METTEYEHGFGAVLSPHDSRHQRQPESFGVYFAEER